MPWSGPRFAGHVPSLGYELLETLSDVLPSPADNVEELVFTEEQARLIIAWYQVDPRSGAFVYRRGITEMAKGWGKSPLLASIAIAEFALPVLFAGWDAEGMPVARPWGTRENPAAWVQIAAVSEDQTDNTYLTLYELLTANEAKAAESLGIDVGRTRLHLRARPATALEPVTASAGSREGQRLTFVVLDETHLWTTQNKGVKLAATLRRNAAKMSGRTFETTNAPVLGEGSVAEVSGKDVDAGAPGILYYNRRPAVEPDPGWSDEQLEEALRHCYGGARWVTDNLARIVAEVRDPATEWTDALRFFFNIRTTGAGKAVDPRRWDELLAPGEVGEGTEIGVGFKSSQVATVIRGCTREGYAWTLAEWHRPEGVMGWRVDRADVSAAVARIFERYHVGRMLCDPPGWRSEIEEWEATWPDRVLAFETSSNRRFALAVDRWTTAIREGSHHHDGDPITREHVRQATLRKVHVTQADEDSRTLYVLQEVGNVAAAISDVLALEAASTMEALPVVAVRWV